MPERIKDDCLWKIKVRFCLELGQLVKFSKEFSQPQRSYLSSCVLISAGPTLLKKRKDNKMLSSVIKGMTLLIS